MLTEIILGFGEPLLLARERTQKVSIETIVAPVDGHDKPIYNKARCIISNITDLPKLKLRSTFLNGEIGNNHIPHKKSIQLPISLNPSHYKIIQLHKIPQVKRWFSDTNNQYFQKLQYMNALAVDDENTGKLFLIPSTVIANYYLGHTLLIKEAIKQTPTPVNSLYHPELSSLQNPNAYIHLKNKIPFKLAPHIARYKMDPYAQEVFKSVHQKSFIPIGGLPSSFYMRPPINEKVTWLLDCVESSLSNVIWVTQIISCSSNFPFSTLVIGADKVKYIGKGKSPYQRKKRNIKIIDHNAKSFKVGENSNSVFDILEIESGEIKNKYPGLHDIKFKKIKNIIVKEKNKIITEIKNPREIARYLSSGPNFLGDPNNIVPTEIANLEDIETLNEDENEKEEDSNKPDIRFVKFLELIDILSKNYPVETLQFDQSTPQTPPLEQNILPLSSLTIDIPWCREYKLSFKTEEEREFEWDQIARRFVIKKLLIDKVYVYIIEFIYWSQADKSATLVITASDEISDENILSEIVNYSRRRSRWANTNAEKGYIKYRIFHNDLEHYAEKYSIKIVGLAQYHKQKVIDSNNL